MARGPRAWGATWPKIMRGVPAGGRASVTSPPRRPPPPGGGAQGDRAGAGAQASA